MQRKRAGLEGTTVLCQRWWEPFWEAGHPKTPGLWLEYGPWQPILGGAECPTAQRPGHAQSGQRRLAGLWPPLATEVPLLVPLSLSTGCHCSECASPFRDSLGPEINHLPEEWGLEAGGRESQGQRKEGPFPLSDLPTSSESDSPSFTA